VDGIAFINNTNILDRCRDLPGRVGGEGEPAVAHLLRLLAVHRLAPATQTSMLV
jgi:hypothetical protein